MRSATVDTLIPRLSCIWSESQGWPAYRGVRKPPPDPIRLDLYRGPSMALVVPFSGWHHRCIAAKKPSLSST